MAEAGSIVIDRNGYLDFRSRSAVTFDLDARLPGQVFKESAEDSLFCEFDAVLTPEFWPALCTMARWHGDDHIELLVLEPDCDDFYVSEGLGFPAVSLSVEAGEDDYWAAVGFEPDGDVLGSIAISANVIAVTGPSGKWGCWGERDPEVAVFRGFPNAAARNEWRAQFGPFLEVSGALESYLPLTFAGRTVPDEYAATLTANYGPRAVDGRAARGPCPRPPRATSDTNGTAPGCRAFSGGRVFPRGSANGLDVEMWVNKQTRTIETAYPAWR